MTKTTEKTQFKIDKSTFKICEAVRLGLDYYYMGPKDKRKLTIQEIEAAARILPNLPNEWWVTEQDWNVCDRFRDKDKSKIL